MKIISPNDLDRILKPEGYSYVLVTKLTSRDRIRWFDQDAVVTAVNPRPDAYYIKVIDPFDQKEKEFKYKKTDELVIAPRNHLN